MFIKSYLDKLGLDEIYYYEMWKLVNKQKGDITNDEIIEALR